MKALLSRCIPSHSLVTPILFDSTKETESRNVRQRVGDYLGDVDDCSEALLQGLRNKIVGNSEIQTLPTADACKAMLSEHPLKIKVTEAWYLFLRDRLTIESINFRAFEQNAHIAFQVTQNENEMPHFLMKFLANIDLDALSWTGETEDEIHAFVETAVTGPIQKFCKNTLRISRNKSLKTSTGRADYSISSGYRQIFRGEDKMRPRVMTEDPMEELIAKSPKGQQWVTLYGPNVPYIFGYYSIGGTNDLLIHFVCIARDSQSVVNLTTTPFDLTKFSGVFGCRCFMLVLIPHLMSLKDAITTTIGLEWKVERFELRGGLWESWDVHVVLDHEHRDCVVAKNFYYQRAQVGAATRLVQKWNHLFSLLPQSPYLMKLRRITHTLSAADTEAGTVRCVFEPLCQPNSVSSVFDSDLSARLAVLHVVQALVALHEKRLVHNDVRWPNVVRKQGEEVYVLVDYDEMEELDNNGTVPPILWMDIDTHAHHIREAHDQKVDLWGLCKMLSELQCRSGDVADLVAAGIKWLRAYPHLPDDLLTEVGLMCAH